MNEEFNKKIKSWRETRLSTQEKETMLQQILSTPIKSPFVFRYREFAFALSLFLMVSVGVLHASSEALPGDLFYPIKTNLVEPIVERSLRTPEEKVVWEETKIDRRISEAEKLIEKNNLDEKKLKKLEESVKKSSQGFVMAAEAVASSTSSTTSSRKEKANNIKKELRQKIEQRDGGDRKKIKRLKDSVIEVLGD